MDKDKDKHKDKYMDKYKEKEKQAKFNEMIKTIEERIAGLK